MNAKFTKVALIIAIVCGAAFLAAIAVVSVAIFSAHSKMLATDSGSVAKYISEAKEEMTNYCIDVVGFTRLRSISLLAFDKDFKDTTNIALWKGYAEADYISKIGGAERTNISFRFKYGTNPFLSSRDKREVQIDFHAMSEDEQSRHDASAATVAEAVEPKVKRYVPLTEEQKIQAERTLSILSVRHNGDANDLTMYGFDVPTEDLDIALTVSQFKGRSPVATLLLTYRGADRVLFDHIVFSTDKGPFVSMLKDTPMIHPYLNGYEETFFVSVDDNIDSVEMLIASKVAAIKFERRDTYVTFILNQPQKIRLAQMLLVYRYLGGNFDL